MKDRRSQPLTWSRCEAKYFITESQAVEVRRCCLDHLPPDVHTPFGSSSQYLISSTYLDSASYLLLRQTLARQVRRWKLRVRTYGARDDPSAQSRAFLEVKRKVNGIVYKDRAPVSGGMARSLLAKAPVSVDIRDEYEPAAQASINRFVELRDRIDAAPTVGISYLREAYEGSSLNRVRITLDRNLEYGLPAASPGDPPAFWRPARLRPVILEVKFTNSFPFWVADMLRRLEVIRRGVCKYMICAEAACLACFGISRAGDTFRMFNQQTELIPVFRTPTD
jgi:hypothetical protein